MVEIEETGKVKRVEVQDESNSAMIEFENADRIRTMLKLERNNHSSFNAMVSVCTIARLWKDREEFQVLLFLSDLTVVIRRLMKYTYFRILP